MSTSKFREQFQELTKLSIDEQLEFFLKRYILLLGDQWEDVQTLSNKFAKYTEARNDTSDLNVTEAADFLQKNGKTRTANERKEELKDIDLDNNGRIAFIEYLLLHYKVMVLKDFFGKKGQSVPKEYDLSKDGIGVTGVGDYILEALFTFGKDVDPEIEKAIENLMKERKERENKIAKLKAVVDDSSKSQVQRMKAKHELYKVENEDTSGANVALIRLMAGRKRVQRNALKAQKENEEKLQANKASQEEDKKKKLQESKNKLLQMKRQFEENAKKSSQKHVKKNI